MTQNRTSFSELVFRFHILPKLPKRITEICLILLTESRYVIWKNRNLAKHENKNESWSSLLSQFFASIKLSVLADRQLMPFENFIDDRCICDIVFCVIDLRGAIQNFVDKLNNFCIYYQILTKT